MLFDYSICTFFINVLFSTKEELWNSWHQTARSGNCTVISIIQINLLSESPSQIWHVVLERTSMYMSIILPYINTRYTVVLGGEKCRSVHFIYIKHLNTFEEYFLFGAIFVFVLSSPLFFVVNFSLLLLWIIFLINCSMLD